MHSSSSSSPLPVWLKNAASRHADGSAIATHDLNRHIPGSIVDEYPHRVLAEPSFARSPLPVSSSRFNRLQQPSTDEAIGGHVSTQSIHRNEAFQLFGEVQNHVDLGDVGHFWSQNSQKPLAVLVDVRHRSAQDRVFEGPSQP